MDGAVTLWAAACGSGATGAGLAAAAPAAPEAVPAAAAVVADVGAIKPLVCRGGSPLRCWAAVASWLNREAALAPRTTGVVSGGSVPAAGSMAALLSSVPSCTLRVAQIARVARALASDPPRAVELTGVEASER